MSYVGATSTQWSFIMIFLHLFQIGLRKLPNILPSFVNSNYATSVIVSAFFFFMSVRSRVFSPLDNSRPSASKDDPVFKDRKRPSWQPPPLAFPIIWTSIGLLRTISSVLIWKSAGTILTKPIFYMMAHLAIGDTWNTINNVPT